MITFLLRNAFRFLAVFLTLKLISLERLNIYIYIVLHQWKYEIRSCPTLCHSNLLLPSAIVVPHVRGHVGSEFFFTYISIDRFVN